MKENGRINIHTREIISFWRGNIYFPIIYILFPLYFVLVRFNRDTLCVGHLFEIIERLLYMDFNASNPIFPEEMCKYQSDGYIEGAGGTYALTSTYKIVYLIIHYFFLYQQSNRT
jgi:hypothetical protein